MQWWRPTGQLRRTRVLNSPFAADHEFSAALPAPDGGYFLTGTAHVNGYGGELLRCDSAGLLLWSKFQGWGYNDYWWDIQATPQGTPLLAGPFSTRANPGTFAVRLLEVDAQGDSVRGAALAPWGNGRNIRFLSGYNRLLPLPDGGFLLPVGLDTTVQGWRYNQPALIKVNRQLQVEWTHLYRPPGPIHSHFYCNATVLRDSSVLVLGYEQLPVSPKLYLHHFSPAGQLLRTVALPSQLCTGLRPICLAGDGRTLYVAGETLTPDRRAWVGVVDLQGLPPAMQVVTASKPPAPAAPALAVFPNPAGFGAAVTVRAEAGPPGRTLRLLDGLGRVVQQAALPVGGETQLPVAGLPGGLYLLQLRDAAGRLLATQKLVVP